MALLHIQTATWQTYTRAVGLIAEQDMVLPQANAGPVTIGWDQHELQTCRELNEEKLVKRFLQFPFSVH